MDMDNRPANKNTATNLLRQISLALALTVPLSTSVFAGTGAGTGANMGPSVAGELESIKLDVAMLKRDLVILEEELLFPASSQMAVYVAMDVGEFFQLDSVTVELNGKEVSHHLYTERQADALHRGGVDRVYLGNVKQGNNQLTAFFVGRGPDGRDYRRATSVDFEKAFEPTFIELDIADSTAEHQPEFRATVVK